MTSSIFALRRARVLWAPRTQVTASTTLDLPEPLGPTTAVTPVSNSSTVLSAKDLKPFMVNRFRNTGRRYQSSDATPFLALAFRAEECRAPAHRFSHDWLSALEARQALPVVHLVVLLILAGDAVGVDELLVVERRTAVLDRLGEGLGDRAMQSTDLDRRERLGFAVEAQSRGVEDLVGVDVADARDDVLVREDGLESASSGCAGSRRSGPSRSGPRRGRRRGAPVRGWPFEGPRRRRRWRGARTSRSRPPRPRPDRSRRRAHRRSSGRRSEVRRPGRR